jgi:hypothetical protein
MSSTLVVIRREEVPQYLQTSGFYKSLWADSDEEFDRDGDEGEGVIVVPENCAKFDLELIILDDVTALLATVRFWVATSIPDELVAYALHPETKNTFAQALCTQDFQRDLSFLQPFVDVTVESDPRRQLLLAAELGQVQLVLYLLRRYKLPLSHELSASAARHGQLQCLKLLFEMGCPWDGRTCEAAAGGGHVHCLVYAYLNGCSWVNGSVCEVAAMHGHLPCLVFAAERKAPMDRLAVTLAAGSGHMECLRFMVDRGCRRQQPQVCQIAAAGGHLACLIFLRDKGFSWDHFTCEAAARNGHLGCLQFAIEGGCRSEQAARVAAASGHLHCLQYAHSTGSHMFHVASVAAAHGHMDCLVYGYKHGSPLSHLTYRNACTGCSANKESILRFLELRGCHVDPSSGFHLLGMARRMLGC